MSPGTYFGGKWYVKSMDHFRRSINVCDAVLSWWSSSFTIISNETWIKTLNVAFTCIMANAISTFHWTVISFYWNAELMIVVLKHMLDRSSDSSVQFTWTHSPDKGIFIPAGIEAVPFNYQCMHLLQIVIQLARKK